MPRVKAVVVSLSKKVTLRKSPDDPWENTATTKSYRPGETVIAETNSALYDWTGDLFYPVYMSDSQKDQPIGYINAKAISLKGVERNASQNHPSGQYPINHSKTC